MHSSASTTAATKAAPSLKSSRGFDPSPSLNSRSTGARWCPFGPIPPQSSNSGKAGDPIRNRLEAQPSPTSPASFRSPQTTPASGWSSTPAQDLTRDASSTFLARALTTEPRVGPQLPACFGNPPTHSRQAQLAGAGCPISKRDNSIGTIPDPSNATDRAAEASQKHPLKSGRNQKCSIPAQCNAFRDHF